MQPVPAARRIAMLRSICLAAIAFVLTALLFAPPARANSIVVNSKLDTSGNPLICTLRDAISAANLNSPAGGCGAGTLGADVITFNLGNSCLITQCTILLAGSLPTVTQELTIDGGSARPNISGANTYQVFRLGAVAVNLKNLRVADGVAVFGGNIQASGTFLSLVNVQVAGGRAAVGGGIFTSLGSLSVVNSTFLGNISPNGGCGALCWQNGLAVISHSRFASNRANFAGAAGFFGDGSVQITDSLFEDNYAADSGGAVFLSGGLLQAVITDSLFIANHVTGTLATYGGGAITYFGGSFLLSESSVYSNSSTGPGGGLSFLGPANATLSNVTLSGNVAWDSGGGIFAQDLNLNNPVTVTLNNATLSLNVADFDSNGTGNGGGILAVSGLINVRNSIIAGNFDTIGNAGPGAKHPDCSGLFASPRYNLIGRNDGCVGFVHGSNGNLVGSGASPLDPHFAPLDPNGGPLIGPTHVPLLTHALLSDSPAIDVANPAVPGSGGFACTAADQRGFKRPRGLACDMGALEAGFLYLPLILR